MTRLDLEMSLPADYRLADLLSFHRRDAQALAERVTDDGLDKGLLWQGLPACLSLRFAAHRVRVSLQVDGDIDGDPQPLEALAAHMLGLAQPVHAFEAAYGAHPLLGRLIAANRGLRVPQAA